MKRFQDRVVIVTGSSSGIGEATARRFGDEGAAVVVNSSTSVDAGRAVAASLDRSIYVQADVSDPAGAESLVARAVDEFGRLDVLVNNAGVTQVIPHADFDAVTDDLFRRIFEVNVLAPFRLFKLALPHLRGSPDGNVVNVSSIAGVRPTGSSIPYATSKAALNHLTALLANAAGPDVRVNAVAPGLIRTPWTAEWEPLHRAMGSRAPLGRSGEADEIAAVITDLAASTYLTGQVLSVDGGLGLR